MNSLRIALAGLVTLVALGCGPSSSGPAKHSVSGTVTVDGEPMSEGLVYFKSDATGAFDALDVRDGKYEGQVEEGERRVEVHAFKVTEQDFDGMVSEIKEELIAPEFNRDSTLTANITAEGPNEFPFEVKSKGK